MSRGVQLAQGSDHTENRVKCSLGRKDQVGTVRDEAGKIRWVADY